MKDELERLKKRAVEEIKEADSEKALDDLRINYLGRKGELTTILRNISSLSESDRPTIGKLANEVKTEIEALLKSRRNGLQSEKLSEAVKDEVFDITAPGIRRPSGSLHPLTQIQREVEDIFATLGFSAVETPEVESEYYCFESLNIPKHHPARDMQDTFWLEDGNVLRTHTTTFQVRFMKKYGVPIRIIQPGRCFRYEATDASHDTTFYQTDGLMVDKNISIAHLKGIMKTFLSKLFKREVLVRFRPAYYPFVEPGLDLDFNCLICEGKGCSVCKGTGWVEFMGSGMVHPNVFKGAGIDPNEYTGFAFGFGLTRLVMMKYKIDDIRLLLSGDLRFLRQFT